MTATLPVGAPQTLGAAFAHIGSVVQPTVLDMKVMVLLEAAGQTLYDVTAQSTDNAEVQDLLRANGREEMAHAHRVSKAIHAMTGEEFLPPAAADNPYLAGPLPGIAESASPEDLEKLAQAEFGGDALYAGWADATGNAEAARLFRLNGSEESRHGNRLLEAASILRGQSAH
jgi:rubrerythrin